MLQCSYLLFDLVHHDIRYILAISRIKCQRHILSMNISGYQNTHVSYRDDTICNAQSQAALTGLSPASPKVEMILPSMVYMFKFEFDLGG